MVPKIMQNVEWRLQVKWVKEVWKCVEMDRWVSIAQKSDDDIDSGDKFD